LAIPALAAPPPRLTHTPVVSQSAAAAGFEKTVRAWAAAQTAPGWLGYEVPAAGHHDMCCFDSWEGSDRRGGACRIEEHGSFSTRDSDDDVGTMDDETAVVLLRAAEGRIGRVRVVSLGCGIDAGGRTLTWVDGVKPAESLALLASLVTSTGRDIGPRQGDGFRAHGHRRARGAGRGRRARAFPRARAAGTDPEEDGVLDGQHARPPRLRGARSPRSRGPEREGTRAGRVRAEPERSAGSGGRHDPRGAEGREHARARPGPLLAGAEAGKKAVAAITGAIADDPETEVKKKAVFALSQLPKEEGVPMLIQVAKTNRNPEVRKQAMFWLGQSGDSRALAYFQEVLTRD
jgi:hypothetical protein